MGKCELYWNLAEGNPTNAVGAVGNFEACCGTPPYSRGFFVFQYFMAKFYSLNNMILFFSSHKLENTESTENTENSIWLGPPSKNIHGKRVQPN